MGGEVALSGKFSAYPEYKESGSKWLDQIPANWKAISLKHVLSMPITDGPHSTPTFIDEGVPFVSAEAVSGGYINFNKIRGFISEADDEFFSQKYRPQRNDVYMVKSGATTGITAIVETDQHFNIWSPLAVMRCKNTYNPYFLLNYLRSDPFQKSVQLSWTFGTQQNIGMGILENLTVCCPPFDEQQKIANFLGHETAKIDTLIEKQQQLIALLKEKRQSVISHAVTKGLNANATMRDSGVEWLGEVPEHWNEVSRIKYISSLKGRQGWQGLKAEEYLEEGPHVVSSAHFTNHQIQWDACPRVSPDRYERDNNIQLSEGDLLLMKDGAAMGKLAYVDELPGRACLNSHLLLFRPKNQNEVMVYSPRFMYYFMQTEFFQSHIKIYGTGVTFLGISQQAIGNYRLAFPPLSEQQEITEFLERETDKLDKLARKQLSMMFLLQERRTALISAAVTGKIDVRNWATPKIN
jgi:type I restriction enzyme S subunit